MFPFCHNNLYIFFRGNCSTKKLILFFPYTRNDGDDDIGNNSISKIPNDSRILHVVSKNVALLMFHIDFVYFFTKFVIRVSSDSFKIMLSSFNLPFRSSLSCWMTLIFCYFKNCWFVSVNGRWNCRKNEAFFLKRLIKPCQTWKNFFQ